jgi:integrase/recombinase XerD
MMSPWTSGICPLPTSLHLLWPVVLNCAGLTPRSASCRPRLHDIRHGFAVRTLLDAYQDGGDPGARLALLSTYLGHVDPGKTYWYLSAAPELLQFASARLERHLGGGA